MIRAFVTGTGTEIGKTYVSCLLVRHLVAAGREVLALKPVMSGYDPAAFAASDAGLLLAAAGRRVDAEAVAAIAPYRYAAPLSPDMAAAAEGRCVDFEGVVGFCRRELAAAAGDVLIEGVGGAMVPLDARRTVLDWMAALDLPVVLVAGSYLGTLSHTLTAAAVIAARGLQLAAIVVNETPGATVSLEATVANLAGRCAVPIIAVRR